MKVKKTFTLIELLVVSTVIMLLLSGGIITYSQLTKQSRDARRKSDLQQVRAALEMYRSNNNQYPISDYTNLSNFLVNGTIKYLEKLPNDPKSSQYSYYYTSTGSDYTLAGYLETGGTNCVVDGCGGSCNYCLGPYGEK